MSLNDLIKEGYWPTDSVPTLPVTSGLEFYLDASVRASVDVPNQLWRNLVASPASGAAQTDYDFKMGANTTVGDSDEPLHVGTATGGHGNAYWNMGGDDYFKLSSNTTFIESWHKDGAQFTLIFIGKFLGENKNAFVDTENSSTPGIQYSIPSGRTVRFSLNNSGSFGLDTETDNAIGNATRFQALSIDEAGATGFHYGEGNYMQVGGSDTFDATYSSPSSNDSGFALELGSGNQNPPFKIGSQISVAIAYNRALSKAEMDKLYNHFVNRGYL